MENISEKKYARIAGVLYLVIIICAGFSQGAIRESVMVSGDSFATAENILGSSYLFRIALIADLVAFMSDIGVSILLYYLLKPVSQILSLVAASFRLIAHPAIGSLNLLNHFAALRVLESPSLTNVYSMDELFVVSNFFMEAHFVGYLIAGALFGIHCLILGYLLYKSDWFPKIIGVLLGIAGIGYLTESFGFMLIPEHKSLFAVIVGISAGIGEITLCLWLLIKGVKQ